MIDRGSIESENWTTMRELGHKMVDDMVDFLQDIPDKPVWKPIPPNVKDSMNENIPLFSEDIYKVYDEFKQNILPYPKGNIHPRFFAWVQGSGSLLGAYSDMLASTMNPNVTIGEHSAMYVDKQVVEWCKQMLNYPVSSSGILLSSGSMANITALTIARNYFIKSIREEGFQNNDNNYVLYCSVETHNCISKAAEILGIGNKNVRKIKTNKDYKLCIETLLEEIKKDLKNGSKPFCVVGTAGTVNTGAIDPLEEIYNICNELGLWFHIDGAYGALAKLDPSKAEELKYIELADSVAFDLHKWLHIPYEVGCLLVKNAEIHRNTFASSPDYLQQNERGLAGGLDSINNYGFELSRSFKALKVWMSLKTVGIKKFAQSISENNEQAKYLGKKVSDHPLLSLTAPVSLSIVCFQFGDKSLSRDFINNLNKEIIIQLQEKGIASPSSTILNGKYCIRVCIVNHKTRKKDIDLLLDEIIHIGNSIIKNETPLEYQI